MRARRYFAIAIGALGALAMGCGGDEPEGTDAAPPRAAPAWEIVALGDSATTGEGDTTGLGWVERYARLLRQRVRAKLIVTNLAENGKSSDQLLRELQADPATRRQVARARIVLFGIGGADLNAGDERLQAGRCRGRACYAPVLGRFARNFDAAVATVRELRGSHATALRAIAPPNVIPGAEDVVPAFATRALGLFQARTEKQAICRAMTRHDGRCVDLVRAFNGPSGTEDAYEKGLMNHDDCCYPSAAGQQLIAELLLRTGLAPIPDSP